MPESIRSKLSMPSGRVVPSALLVSWLALPVLLSALPGCSGEPDASQIDSPASGNSSSIGGSVGVAGGPDLIMPSWGGTENGAGGSGNATGVAGAGPYQLPPDYTKATMGRFKLGDPVEAATGGAGGSAGGSGCGTAILGVVRDFKGKNEPGGHPDFEAYSGPRETLGIVKAVLGDDQKPVYNGIGDEKIVDPKNGQQTTSKTAFDQWYRATKDVNKPYIVYFYFEPNNGVLTFQSSAFFPLDGKGWGNTPNWPHNFGFTTELHTQFNYKGGETFSFTGDDDLWVFINHKLAIDLGGLHSQRSKTISLDAEAAKLGITIGQNYNLDLFHAERHTDASNFRVDTNLAFTNCGTVVEEPIIK